MALTKINASVIANNTIAVGNIADNSVDATKIASNSILTRHIDDDQITGDQLADNITIAGTLTSTGNITGTLATAAQTVRANRFAGQLNCVLHPHQIEDILQDLTTASFAGSDALNEALRQGLVGTLFGMNIWQSASVGKDNSDADYAGAVWAENAFGIAMFKGLDVEFQRNSAAVGNDIVASLHAKAALVDANRACKIISAV